MDKLVDEEVENIERMEEDERKQHEKKLQEEEKKLQEEQDRIKEKNKKTEESGDGGTPEEFNQQKLQDPNKLKSTVG